MHEFATVGRYCVDMICGKGIVRPSQPSGITTSGRSDKSAVALGVDKEDDELQQGGDSGKDLGAACVLNDPVFVLMGRCGPSE